MMEYFTPYEGKNPYVFISYAHLNSERVLITAARLHKERFRVWYDEGIPAGKDWPKSVQDHLRRSKAVFFFMSENSLASDNCFSEIATAVELEIPVYVIKLDESEPKDRWETKLANAEFIEDLAAEDNLGEAFHYLPDEDDTGGGYGKKINGWIILAIFSAVLLVATLTGAWGLANGWFPELLPSKPVETIATPAPEPQPTVDPGQWGSIFKGLIYLDFPDAEQKDAVQLMLGSYENNIGVEDAAKIKELFFCGSMALDTDENISWKDGKYMVRSSAPAEGRIKDLAFIAKFLNLEKLVLINQEADSIEQLKNLSRLRELNVSACRISTLKDISGFESLETLHIEHTQIKDITPLSNIPNLKTVTVSAEMLPLKLDPKASYEVILVK